MSESLSFAASPFPITIGPEQAVAHRAWREARNLLLTATAAGPRLVLVFGPAGTGKTLLLQDLCRTLRARGSEVLLQLRGDLPVTVAGESVGRRVVLIDEADRLNAAALERLAGLGTCTIVLARTAGRGEEAGEPSAATTVVRLAALPPEEVGPFLAARLAQAGLDAGVLSDAAVTELAVRSGGVPRVLNMLAGAALFLARAEGARQVGAEHVDQAAALRDGDDGIGATPPPGAPVPASAPPQAPRAARAAPVQALPRARIAALSTKAGTQGRHAAALAGGATVAAAFAWLLLGQGERAQLPRFLVAEVAALPAAPEREVQATVSVPPVPQLEPAAPASLAPPQIEAATAPSTPPPPAEPPPPASVAARSEVADAPPPPPERALAVMSVLSPAAPAMAAVSLAAGELVAAVARVPEPGALPLAAPARVQLRYARASADAAGQAAGLAQALRAAGFAVADSAALPRRDVKPGVRYFFAEDRETAAAVLKAAGLSGKGMLAEAARLEAPPRPGMIELVVVPGQVAAGSRPELSSPGHS